MVEPEQLPSRRPKEEKTPEEKRKEFKVIKGGGRKGWGPGAKAGAIAASTAAVVSGVAAALGETDNLPDPLQGFYNQVFHPRKVVEEISNEPVKAYSMEEANEDFAKIVKETKETQETPLVIEEKTPGPIEWEGAIIPAIEGLRFDKGTFFAEAGNPYNLEIGEKAGVFVKEAVEINEKMESAIGLRPEVIEAMQKEIMEEEKEFRYPLPFNLEEAKGVKIKEVVFKKVYTDLPEEIFGQKEVKPRVVWLNFENGHPGIIEDTFLDKNLAFLIISNVPIGTKIFSSVSTSELGYDIWDNNSGRNNPSEPSNYALDFEAITAETYKEGLLFNNERVDVVRVGFSIMGVSLLPSGIEKNITQNETEGYSFLTETKIGRPIAEVVEKATLSPFSFREPDDFDSLPTSTDPQIKMSCTIYQLKNKDGQVELSNFSKALELGSVGLFKIENIPVFISQ